MINMDENKFVLQFENEELSVYAGVVDCQLIQGEKKIYISANSAVATPFDDPLAKIKKYDGRKADVRNNGYLYKDILVVVN